MRDLKDLNVKMGLIAWGSLPGSTDKSTDEVGYKVNKIIPCTLSCGWKLWGFIFQIFLSWFGCVGVWCEFAVMKR